MCDHYQRGNGYFCCYKCRSDTVARHRKKNKQILVELGGGKCEVCGYNRCQRSLDFHHFDPMTKKFGIADANGTRSLNELKEEMAKCYLLCKNCHTEAEEGMLVLKPK